MYPNSVSVTLLLGSVKEPYISIEETYTTDLHLLAFAKYKIFFVPSTEVSNVSTGLLTITFDAVTLAQ